MEIKIILFCLLGIAFCAITSLFIYLAKKKKNKVFKLVAVISLSAPYMGNYSNLIQLIPALIMTIYLICLVSINRMNKPKKQKLYKEIKSYKEIS